MADIEFVSEEECKRRRDASCCGVREVLDGLSCTNELLRKHDLQAIDIGKDVDKIEERITGFDSDLKAITASLLTTVQVQNQAADIIRQSAEASAWNRAELTEYRKASTKVVRAQNRTIRDIVLKMAEIIGTALLIIAGAKVAGL